MTAEQLNKEQFITHELTEICKIINNHICGLDYFINSINDEYVKIWYKNNSGYYYINVCITADSIGCIVIDVIRKIIY